MTLRNERTVATTLTLEPWGDQTTLEPWGDQTTLDAGGVVTLACAGPAGGRVEVVLEERGLVVYGWPGSVIELVSPGVGDEAVGPDLPTWLEV
ncbi:hypothetical protein L6R46_23200 [Myxococcota bacterium]|nr:hypothetical protein [Myxococcota bacterium]